MVHVKWRSWLRIILAVESETWLIEVVVLTWKLKLYRSDKDWRARSWRQKLHCTEQKSMMVKWKIIHGWKVHMIPRTPVKTLSQARWFIKGLVHVMLKALRNPWKWWRNWWADMNPKIDEPTTNWWKDKKLGNRKKTYKYHEMTSTGHNVKKLTRYYQIVHSQ